MFLESEIYTNSGPLIFHWSKPVLSYSISNIKPQSSCILTKVEEVLSYGKLHSRNSSEFKNIFIDTWKEKNLLGI